MAEIEVRAAHNVLEACAQTNTLEKVIFTSSATAVVWTETRNDSPSSSADVDERSWSDINFCKKYKVLIQITVKSSKPMFLLGPKAKLIPETFLFAKPQPLAC